MSNDAREVIIKDKKLVCPICHSTMFWEKQTLMNTAGATFFGFDWANTEATNYICDDCGYIMWFWPQ